MTLLWGRVTLRLMGKIVGVLIVVIVIVSIVGIVGFKFLHPSSSTVNPATQTLTGPSSARQTDIEAANKILAGINNKRTDVGLLKIKLDEKLCAYSKRLSLLMVEKNLVPGDKEIGDDVSSDEVQKTYFAAYRETLIETGVYKEMDVDRFVKYFTRDAKASPAMKVDAAGGCVTAIFENQMNKWIVNFVGGTTK